MKSSEEYLDELRKKRDLENDLSCVATITTAVTESPGAINNILRR